MFEQPKKKSKSKQGRQGGFERGPNGSGMKRKRSRLQQEGAGRSLAAAKKAFKTGRDAGGSGFGGGKGGKQQRSKMQQMLEARRKGGGASSPSRSGGSTASQTQKKSAKKKAGGGGSKLSQLQQRFMDKLKGSKFRWINEQLYTTSGSASFELFQEQPDLFDVYHRGFREQVKSWPANPLDIIIARLRDQPELVVGDFGCGEARLARSIPATVHSFDLVAANDTVTACDMSDVPLADGALDVAVFCLALMGTNVVDFVTEAHRVLKPGGRLMIAEVRSRFEGKGDGPGDDDGYGYGEDDQYGGGGGGQGVQQRAEGGYKAFIATLGQIGFSFRKQTKDIKNQIFVMLDFVKEADDDGGATNGQGGGAASAGATAGAAATTAAKKKKKKKKGNGAPGSDDIYLKACRYKKR
eukprot:g877.t1